MSYSVQIKDYGGFHGKKISILEADDTDLAIELTDYKLYIMQDSYEIEILKRDIKEFCKALEFLLIEGN